jgi:hypothetical protein
MICNCILSYLFDHEINDCLILSYHYNLLHTNDYENEIENLENDFNNKIENLENNFNDKIEDIKNNYNNKIKKLENKIEDLENNSKIINLENNLEKTTSFIYILELVENKYYIGRTNNPHYRISQHNNATGSAWTQKYKPLKLLLLKPLTDEFDEYKYTLIFMKNKGKENVRGGSFSQIVLDIYTLKVIDKMLKYEDNVCFHCSEKGYFIKILISIFYHNKKLKKILIFIG